MALSRDRSWDELCEEEFHLSQEEAENVAKAEEVRTPSDDEGGPEAVGPNAVKCWWGKMLLQALKDEGYDCDKIWTNKTLTVVSGCTGCSAESATMKADGFSKNASNKPICEMIIFAIFRNVAFVILAVFSWQDSHSISPKGSWVELRIVVGIRHRPKLPCIL